MWLPWGWWSWKQAFWSFGCGFLICVVLIFMWNGFCCQIWLTAHTSFDKNTLIYVRWGIQTRTCHIYVIITNGILRLYIVYVNGLWMRSFILFFYTSCSTFGSNNSYRYEHDTFYVLKRVYINQLCPINQWIIFSDVSLLNDSYDQVSKWKNIAC